MSPRLLPLLLATQALGQTANLDPLSSGAAAKTGGPHPKTLQLSKDKPASITKLPPSLSHPLYATLSLGPRGTDGKPSQTFHILLDEPDHLPATLFVDANGNGDLTDDAPAQWERSSAGGNISFSGGATLEFRDGETKFPAHILITRQPARDPAGQPVISFAPDYAREGSLSVGGRTYKVMLADDLAAGDFRPLPAPTTTKTSAKPSGVRLFIDLDNNGKFDPRAEVFDAAKPITLAGAVYELDITPLGDHFSLAKSTRTAAAPTTPTSKPAPAPRPGATIAKTFTATTIDNKNVQFPGTYKGKIVLLDFWATWCGPCMGEVPGLVKVYNAEHGHGFEVLGVSLDGENAKNKVLQVNRDKGMTWPQIYDGKHWHARIAELYGIHSIPAPFLVDGDTGEILASGGELRGEALAATVKKALDEKAKQK